MKLHQELQQLKRDPNPGDTTDENDQSKRSCRTPASLSRDPLKTNNEQSVQSQQVTHSHQNCKIVISVIKRVIAKRIVKERNTLNWLEKNNWSKS